MRAVSHDVIWVHSQIRVIFSDETPKRSDDLARPCHCMRAAGSLASRDRAGCAVCPLTPGSSRHRGRRYTYTSSGELSPLVMAGKPIQQVVNFVAGDVGELAGGCALGVEVEDSASFQYVFPYSEADSGLLFVAQQGKVDVEEVEGSELEQRPNPSQRRPGVGLPLYLSRGIRCLRSRSCGSGFVGDHDAPEVPSRYGDRQLNSAIYNRPRGIRQENRRGKTTPLRRSRAQATPRWTGVDAVVLAAKPVHHDRHRDRSAQVDTHRHLRNASAGGRGSIWRRILFWVRVP